MSMKNYMIDGDEYVYRKNGHPSFEIDEPSTSEEVKDAEYEAYVQDMYDYYNGLDEAYC